MNAHVAAAPFWGASIGLLVALSIVEPGTGSIHGTVTGPDGHRIPQAVVVANSAEDGSPVARAVADANGTFQMDVAVGNYNLDVSVACCQYGSGRQEGAAVASGQTLNVKVTLPWGMNLGTEGGDPSLIGEEIRTRSMTPTGPTPRTAAGKPDLTGVWIRENNPNAAGPVPQDWALKVAQERSAANSKDFPSAYCLPTGPAPMTRAYLYQILQNGNSMVVLSQDDVPGHHQVFLDGRPHPSPDVVSWLGHSVGHWEGDTLVVETTNYNDRSWLTLGGLPHTEKLRTVERIRRLDLGHLEIEAVMEDPGALQEAWVRKFTATLAPAGEEVAEYVCNENNKDAAHYAAK